MFADLIKVAEQLQTLTDAELATLRLLVRREREKRWEAKAGWQPENKET